MEHIHVPDTGHRKSLLSPRAFDPHSTSVMEIAMKGNSRNLGEKQGTSIIGQQEESMKQQVQQQTTEHVGHAMGSCGRQKVNI